MLLHVGLNLYKINTSRYLKVNILTVVIYFFLNCTARFLIYYTLINLTTEYSGLDVSRREGGCKKDTLLLRPSQLKRVSGIITKCSRDQTTLTVKAGFEMQEIPLTLWLCVRDMLSFISFGFIQRSCINFFTTSVPSKKKFMFSILICKSYYKSLGRLNTFLSYQHEYTEFIFQTGGNYCC